MHQPHNTPHVPYHQQASYQVPCQAECPMHRCRFAPLGLVLGVALVVVGSLAATTLPVVPEIMQTQRLDVVDEAGKVVFTAYAAGKSGRLEVRDEAGHIIFSVGLTPDKQSLPSSWDRLRLDVEQQQHDVAQQLQSLNVLTRRVQDLERQQRLRRVDQQDQDVDRRLRDLEQQSRTLDSLEREVRQLSRQVDRLERR